MKKIEALIDPCRMEQVKNALIKIGIQRMTISKVDEFESQKQRRKEVYRGDTYMMDVVKEFKIELIVPTDEMLSHVIETIEEQGNISHEEISVSPVEEVTRFTKKGGRDEKN
jgi:nitrogen regulatory protein P-II 1